MVIVSNHLLSKTEIKFPSGTVMRINLAWIKDKATAEKLLEKFEYPVYLDYPQGRSKPPRPTITFEEAVDLANNHDCVQFFAVSNVEEPEKIKWIKDQLRENLELVPKIESIKGIENISEIVNAIGTWYVMLDKEDLWVDILGTMGVDDANKKFDELVERAREKCKESKTNLLELQGVIFT